MSTRSSYLVGKAFRSFLLASVMTAAASQVGTLVDGLMLSRFINEAAMSAINISSPVTQVLFALCILMGVGGSMLAGMAIGNHDREEASRLFSVVLSVTAAIGIAAGAAGIIFMPRLVGLLCPDVNLQGYTAEYLRVIIPASPLYMLMVVVQMFVTLDGEPKRVTAAVATSTVVNLCLDYVFIVWCGWAMTGAAIATVISYLAAVGVLLPHFFRKGTLAYRLPRTLGHVGRIASMGLPFGMATVLIAVQMLGNNIVAMNFLGAAGIVTLSVCMYLLRFSMIILTGTLESFQPVAAILKGSADNRGVALVLGHAYRFLAASLVLFALVLVLFPELITNLFGITDLATVSTLSRALPPFAANIVLQCSVYLLMPVYQIYNHRRMALVISLGQPLLPMLFFWLLSSLSPEHAWVNPWWGFAIGQLCVVAILLPFALTRRGNHLPFVLIPSDSPSEIFDISVAPDVADMESALLAADGWLKSRGVDDGLRVRVVVACEEAISNIVRHALGRRRHSVIDLRITISDKELTAVVRDEGIPFNPVEQDPETGIGLMLLKKTCDDLNYEYIFHQNLLTVKWNKVAGDAV